MFGAPGSKARDMNGAPNAGLRGPGRRRSAIVGVNASLPSPRREPGKRQRRFHPDKRGLPIPFPRYFARG
jgi:hypothetical protein